MNTEFAGMRVEPATVTRQWLSVGEVNGALRLPMIVITGGQPGPKLLVTSGLHGDEYDGLEVALRLADQTDPAALRGTLAIVPRVNVRAFEEGWRWSSIDGLDIDRQFPGRANGFATQRLAKFLTDRLLPEADLILDYHGGTTQLEVISYGAVSAPSPMKEDLAQLLGVRHIWDWTRMVARRGTFMEAADDLGVPTVMVELGGGNRWREEPVEEGLLAARNIMRYLGMIGGSYEPVPDEQIHMRGTFIHADADGFLRPRVRLGQDVSAGDLLAEVVDLLGQPRYAVRADVTGIVNDARTAPSVRCGEWLYLVGEVVERRRTDLAAIATVARSTA